MTKRETNMAYGNVDLFLTHKTNDNNVDYSKAFFQGSRGNAWANKKKYKREGR